MANLTIKEKSVLEALFEMGDGYVLDFYNTSFGRFVGDSIGVDIYTDDKYKEYCSKANKLRQLWSIETDNVFGQLLKDLLDYFEEYKKKRCEILTDKELVKIRDMQLVTQRLLGNQVRLEFPTQEEETLQTLLDDINHSLSIDKPTLVLDRLHTFATKILRNICNENGIGVINDNGDYLPLHSLVGMLKRYYETNSTFKSKFTLNAIQTSISLFDTFNAIRNNQSYAHDNEILESSEAKFAVKAMANVICFLDEVEKYQQKDKRDSSIIF